MIYNEGGRESEKDKTKFNGALQIKLIDLDCEEQRDKEAVKMCMKKFQKLWKNLFSKYANTGFTAKIITNFDQIGEKAQTINYPEITKLVKDHGLLPDYISKEELGLLMRQVNLR